MHLDNAEQQGLSMDAVLLRINDPACTTLCRPSPLHRSVCVDHIWTNQTGFTLCTVDGSPLYSVAMPCIHVAIAPPVPHSQINPSRPTPLSCDDDDDDDWYKQSPSIVESQGKKKKNGVPDLTASLGMGGCVLVVRRLPPLTWKSCSFLFFSLMMNTMPVVLAAVNGDSNFVSTSPVAVHLLNARRTTYILCSRSYSFSHKRLPFLFSFEEVKHF